jgi:hypothetical protein
MMIRKQITYSLNIRISPKLCFPKSSKNCQDLVSMETHFFLNPVSLDTFMKIVMASNTSAVYWTLFQLNY